MSTAKRVLFYSRDPGGTNCIIPVYQRLRRTRGVEVVLWGKDFSILKYKKEGLSYQNVGASKLEEIHELLKQYNPKVLITGTSYGDNTEHHLWKWAKELSIHSIAILDQWLNYRVRFTDNSGKWELPDTIMVMDQFAKTEMVKEGFEGKKLLVTGQPYFEVLESKASQITEAEKRKIKKDFNLQDGVTILFVSEPLSAAPHADMGFTEQTTLRDLVEGICHVHLSEVVHLLVKLHPKQKQEKVRRLIRLLPTPGNLRVLLISDFSVLPLIFVADIVIGMQSTVLIEANLLKKPVVSLQIGRKGSDQFILSKRGIINDIVSKDALARELHEFFNKPTRRPLRVLPVVAHPIENIQEFIRAVL